MDDIPIKRPLLLDGATATNLHKHGYDYNTSFEQYALDHIEQITKLQLEYINAGCDVLLTPTFSANPARLSDFGIEDRCTEINRQLAQLTRKNADGKALVAGNMSPSCRQVEPYGDISFTELMSIYDCQVKALNEFVDLFFIETMSSMSDMRAAVLSCTKTGKPIFLSVSLNDDLETYGDNVPVKSALITLQEMGISAFGINCSSLKATEEAAELLMPYAKVPIFVKPCLNSTNTADELMMSLLKVMKSGVDIIGGCCGTEPKHIATMRKLLDSFDFSKIIKPKKIDTSLILTNVTEEFYLDPTTTEISEPIHCHSEMHEDIEKAMEEAIDVLLIEIDTPDDTIDFARNAPMASLPVMFTSNDEISLRMALMLYQGRALIDSCSEIDEQELNKIAAKYGAVIY